MYCIHAIIKILGDGFLAIISTSHFWKIYPFLTYRVLESWPPIQVLNTLVSRSRTKLRSSWEKVEVEGKQPPMGTTTL